MGVDESRQYPWAITDGRMMLRAVREAAGLSQKEVARRASGAGIKIDQAHLQKIESGRIEHPSAPTLDAILTAGLHVTYRERTDILAAFGHRLRWELPAHREIAVECEKCARDLNWAIWPAYFADFANRIWDWNPLFPRLLGNTADNPANAAYRGLTIMDILCNPEVGTDRQIANAGTFLPAAIGWFKLTSRPYVHEPWFHDFMARAKTWPGFLEMWDRVPVGPQELLVPPPVIPVEIAVPRQPSPLQFRTILVVMPHDPRFAILHLVPLNVATQAVCAAWAAEDAATAAAG